MTPVFASAAFGEAEVARALKKRFVWCGAVPAR